MAAQLLAQSEQRDRERRLLGSIGHSCARAEGMIADLLDFASVRLGQGITIRSRPADLKNTVEQTISELRLAFAHARIRHLSRGYGQIDIDPDRLQQMIGNLVANSVAYGDMTHPVTITTDLAGDAAVIAVHNHGTCIPEALIPSLFEPMTRATDQDATVRSVGLGLFIVRELAEAHGGEITLSSNTVSGTTFSIRLPAGRAS
ncbi:sensor histidine kinase KdpD [Pseudomonas sp. CM25]|uniref:sensor histidine kinase n=1 Tax=Pseudomonas sp. CM25 TaxID=2738448 RepID=UPI0021140A3E|nr:HAMP domain-containing sensor histidine kinase [Pseudomonas sp. CM25]